MRVVLIAVLALLTASVPAFAQAAPEPVSIGRIVVTDRAFERDGPLDLSGTLAAFARPAAFRSPCPWLRPGRGKVARPAATLSGRITRAGQATFRTGPSAGEFRLTTPGGRVIWTDEVSARTGGVTRLFERALQASLRAACQEQRRIRVEVTVALDASNDEARGSVVGRLEAVGIERLGPNGRVERGNFTYEEPVQWEVREAAIGPNSCPATLVSASLPEEGPPTALATTSGNGYLLIVLPEINLTYALADPCSGGNLLLTSISTLPAGITFTIPQPGVTVHRTGTASLGGVTGSYAAEATITRLSPRTPDTPD